MPNGGTVRRPAVPAPVRIRQNIGNLPNDDPIVVFYSRAIGKMKLKGIDEALSWRYQSAIHDYPFPDDTFDQRRIIPGDDPRRNGVKDPLAKDGEALPSDADRRRFWRQCQHGSWFFLPWHRMYLHHFEKIIMDQVVQLKGPKDWALPYWNWDSPDGVGTIPRALRNPKLKTRDGEEENHLFVKERDPDANAGKQFADPVAEVDTAFKYLKPTTFSGIGEFGGAKVRRHGGQGPPDPIPPGTAVGGGILEGTPHGAMHVAVGRPPDGWMRSFTKAPLDPIFWLHHCNIDRMWEIWIQRKQDNRNPDEKDWLDAEFAFHNAAGGTEIMKPRDVVQTRKAPLSYEYDDTLDPLKGA